ncbi:innate immunity activator protein isoform X1 [Salminus brasiliensis]|uniref:innate immunity activator protein isoform X1 n=1 Tax=Salminus brasiliensis TaxID=930266 RepID=UPI003B8356A9
MECKEEISDSDSGIILNSGPDSPTSPVKDLSTHTRVMRLKHQALEDRLELCLLELKKLCIREAELTGKLSSDFPLLPDEKPPQIRRRIGAAFKLDEELIGQDGEESELHVLEADLALHRQIYEAARRLSLEEHISKPVRKSRLQQCKREEKKVKELQEAVLKHRINHGCVSPQTCRSSRQSDLGISDDSSLSDAAALDDDLEPGPLSSSAINPEGSFQRPVTLTLSPSHGPKQAGSSSSLEYERTPIQNTPWKESSLDQPYQKHKKLPSTSSSRSSSSPTGAPSDQRLDEIPPTPKFVFKSLAMRNNNSNSAPSTPELPLRRHVSQSFRLPRPKLDLSKPNSDLNRVRTKLPRRRVTDFALAYSVQRLYQCSSEDSSSEHSISSYSSSSSRESAPETAKACPPPYGYHRAPQNKAQGQRAAPNLPKNNLLRPVTSSSQNNQERMPLESNMSRLNLGLTSPAEPGNLNKPQQAEATSPKRILKPPPPPYSRLARAPSLKEYPNHPSRLLPRDVVANDLKSWHQKNIAGEMKLQPLQRHGSMRAKRSPNQEPPPYHQIQALRLVPQKVILQRASDGTPMQWYEEEDCEIVSQV